jgi:carbonic anhydrase
MDNIIQGVTRFRSSVFERESALYRRLAHDGQQPQALVISCADSRVVPELIAQCGPGELFVCRNAGNIVPPFSEMMGGVSSAIEYAVVALGVRDIVVCGHSDCGAMKALLHPEALETMPNVKAWLRHSHAAHRVVCEGYPAGIDSKAAARALALENVVVQLNHLRTHPSVAARIATGQLSLHGWFFELESGTMLALDGARGCFVPLDEEESLPVALPPARRLVADGLAPAAE